MHCQAPTYHLLLKLRHVQLKSLNSFLTYSLMKGTYMEVVVKWKCVRWQRHQEHVLPAVPLPSVHFLHELVRLVRWRNHVKQREVPPRLQLNSACALLRSAAGT